MDIYADVAQKLLDSGHAYKAYDTAEELEERRNAARAAGKPSGYDGLHRDLTPEQQAAYEAEGREPVIRFKMPEKVYTFNDLVRGEITFDSANVQDYVIVRANGQPLYTLTNPTDDAMMGITHVLRGEDLLSSTPRQIALYEAFAEIGIGGGFTPEFGHLPFVMGEGNRKLSKRDPESNLLDYKPKGFLPEALLNYMALLGWSIADDRDVFSIPEMVEAFEIGRVNPNPARFDIKKAEAINGSHIRLLAEDDLRERLVPYFQDAGLIADPPTAQQLATLAAATPLVHERMALLTEAVDMLRFLFIADDDFAIDEADRGQEPRRQGSRRRTSRSRGACRAVRLVDAGDRGGTPYEPHRRSRAQAATGIRTRTCCRHRQPHLAAAVRVARAARPGEVTGQTGRRARLVAR